MRPSGDPALHARAPFDVLVVGLGVVGSAACRELARRGARVLGIDRFALPHSRGSSHGESRMIRLAYYEHPDYVPLLREAYRGWEALEEAAGERLLFKTGGLYMGRPEPPGELVPESLRAAREHGLPHERIDPDELRRRWPVFELPEGYAGFYEPEAGFLLAERALAALARQAVEAGATLCAGERVLGLRVDRDGVRLDTESGRYRAAHAVLAAGPWSAGLLAGAGVTVALRPTRQVIGWVAPREPDRFGWRELPVWAVESDGREDPGGLWYGIPTLGDLGSRTGMKVGHHFPGRHVDPDRIQTPEEEDGERLVAGIRRHVPSAVGSLLGLDTCLYTLSPDGHFVLDRHPDHPQRLSFACGLSGHGFKFAPVLGQVLADWAIAGGTGLPVGFLGAGRLERRPDGGDATSKGDAAGVRLG